MFFLRSLLFFHHKSDVLSIKGAQQKLVPLYLPNSNALDSNSEKVTAYKFLYFYGLFCCLF